MIRVLAAAGLALALVACGQPTAFHCSTDRDCNDGTQSGVCTNQGFCAFADASCGSGLRYHDSADTFAGQCVGGNASGDTPDMPLPLQPMQMVDVQGAHDDYTPSCGATGGRDIFFEKTLTEPGRLYVDTLGTNFNVILAVHRGTCAARGVELACIDLSCTAQFQQWTDQLSPGTYCIIADQRDGGETQSSLVVRSMLGPQAPLGHLGTNTADTCSDQAWSGTCSPTNAPEQTWFFMSCTSQTFSATTCSSDPQFDGDLQAWGLGSTQLACDSGCPGITATQTQPGPMWIVAEASSMANCGGEDVEIMTQ